MRENVTSAKDKILPKWWRLEIMKQRVWAAVDGGQITGLSIALEGPVGNEENINNKNNNNFREAILDSHLL